MVVLGVSCDLIDAHRAKSVAEVPERKCASLPASTRGSRTDLRWQSTPSLATDTAPLLHPHSPLLSDSLVTLAAQTYDVSCNTTSPHLTVFQLQESLFDSRTRVLRVKDNQLRKRISLQEVSNLQVKFD